MTDSASSSSLAGRHVLVTGGGKGIGRAVAEVLLRQGARVTLLGRDVNRVSAAAVELGEAAFAVAGDVSDRAAVSRAFGIARAHFGEIDTLINNAGQAHSAPFSTTDDELFDRMLAVNLKGAYHCIHEVLPSMLSRNYGRIVNIASTAGLVGYAYCAAYCAAKHGVVGLTRSLALEVARRNITVNAVCPGFTDTDIVQEAVANIQGKTGRSADDAVASLIENNPQRRLVAPTEVANAVLWLCLPGSESITGQSIAVAGGEVT